MGLREQLKLARNIAQKQGLINPHILVRFGDGPTEVVMKPMSHEDDDPAIRDAQIQAVSGDLPDGRRNVLFLVQ
jgi:hypothetical protein